MSKFTTYIIKGTKDFHYCGITSNLKKRIEEHNTGKSKSTKSNYPYTILFTKEFESRTQARLLEVMIKNAGVKRWYLRFLYGRVF